MTENIPELFDDYDPPSVNSSLLQSEFSERSSNFLALASSAASNLRNDKQYDNCEMNTQEFLRSGSCRAFSRAQRYRHFLLFHVDAEAFHRVG